MKNNELSKDFLHLKNLCQNLVDSFSIMKELNNSFYSKYLEKNKLNENEKSIVFSFLNHQKKINWFYFINCARSLRDYLININSFKKIENELYQPSFKSVAFDTKDEELLNKLLIFLEDNEVLKIIFYSLFLDKYPLEKNKKDLYKKKIEQADFYSCFLHWDKYSIDIDITNISKDSYCQSIYRFQFNDDDCNNYFKELMNKFNSMIKNTSIKDFKITIESLFNEFISLTKWNDSKTYFGLSDNTQYLFLTRTLDIILSKYKEEI